jgi:anaerobic sulfite reductase subunit B
VLGFKSPRDILFAGEFEQWARSASVRVTVDKPDEHWKGHAGVITTLLPEVPLPSLVDVAAVVVGPPIMMKFCLQGLLSRGLSAEQIWVSYERRMSCGLGKCGHCKINGKYVCLDGPVFNFSQAQWLVD